MSSNELRDKFLSFFEGKGHKIVPSSSLTPTDPSVLFTTAGMQQFKPYYLGEKSPYGNSVATCQKCIRTSDIEEVGDERHLTFFEMLGNFSFGGYFKKEAIEYAYEFLKSIGIEIEYVTVFEGDESVPKDTETEKIWNDLGFKGDKVRFCGRADNFWGPTGEEGPCGPTTEIYACPEGNRRAGEIEIWNIVFNQYFSDKDKNLKELELKGIDTGMGLERLAMVSQKKSNVFETDLFLPLLSLTPDLNEKDKRIIADHSRAIYNILLGGVLPSNKGAGYILRRLMRRVIAKEYLSKQDFVESLLLKLGGDKHVLEEFSKEKEKFLKTLELGIKEFHKGTEPFKLYESYGLPFDVLKDLDPKLNYEEFEKEMKKHQELSRTASSGMFKGGLADEGEEVVKLHTATHLLNEALRQVISKDIRQRGSNITKERLRFDFNFERKLTPEEIKKVEDKVNEIIEKDIEVEKMEMPFEKAQEMGAQAEFGTKYPENVSVYKIGEYSLEICRGPHVKRTSDLGKFKIIKEEASSAGVRRIKAICKLN